MENERVVYETGEYRISVVDPISVPDMEEEEAGNVVKMIAIFPGKEAHPWSQSVYISLLKDGEISVQIDNKGDGPFSDLSAFAGFENLEVFKDILNKVADLLASNQK